MAQQTIVQTDTFGDAWTKQNANNTELYTVKADLDDDVTFLSVELSPSSAPAIVVNPHGVGAGETGEIRLLELVAGGTNYVGFKAPDAIASSLAWVLPNADGANGEVLQTNGSGALSWVAQSSGSPGGAATNIQFNTAGAFDGDAELAWLTATSQLVVGALNLVSSVQYPLQVNVSASNNNSIFRTGNQGSSVTTVCAYGDTGGASTGNTTAADIGRFSFGGYANTLILDAAYILGTAVEAWQTGEAGCEMSFWTTPENSDVAAKRMTIADDGLVSLGSGTGVNEFSIDGTLAGDSDDAIPTEKAVKTYVDAVGGSPGGANTQVQFNNLGVFDGDAGLTFISGTNQLVVGGVSAVTSSQYPLQVNNSTHNTNILFRTGSQGASTRITTVCAFGDSGAASFGNTGLADIGKFAFGGYANSVIIDAAYMLGTATEAWATSQHGCELSFWTTPENTNTQTKRLTIQDDGVIVHIGSNLVSYYESGNGQIESRSYSATAAHAGIMELSRSRGTNASPAQLNDDDSIGILRASGYHGGTGWGIGAQIQFKAAEAFDTATDLGTDIEFYTCPVNSGTLTKRFTITEGGLLEGINTSSSNVNLYVYSTTSTDSGKFQGYHARGTEGSPAAVQNNDVLALFGGIGYGTSFSYGAIIRIEANQTWTGSAHGTRISFQTKEDGTTSLTERMLIKDDGDVDFTEGIKVGARNTAEAGAIEWDGSNFRGYTGATWVNLDYNP